MAIEGIDYETTNTANGQDAVFSLTFLQYVLAAPFEFLSHFRENFLDYVTDSFINMAQFISFISSVGGITYFVVPVIAAILVIISGALFARRRGEGSRFWWPYASTKKSNLFSHGQLGKGGQEKHFRAGAAHLSVIIAYRGTILPRILKQVIFSSLFAHFLCYLWYPVKKAVEGGEAFRFCSAEKGTCWTMDMHITKIVYHLFLDADQAFKYLTPVVTFILGFYNSSMYSRWWTMRTLAGDVRGRSVDTMVMLQAYMTEIKPNEVAKANEDRRQLLRYLGLAQALSLQAAMREGGKDLEHLCARGLLDKNSSEFEALSRVSTSGYSEVYGWFLHYFQTACLHRYVQKDLRGHVLVMVQTNITKVRGAAADVMMYLNEPMPLAYRHLLELLVMFYMLVTPVALVPQLLWVSPFIVSMVVVFVAGFLELSVSVMNDPFRDHDGFLVDNFLDGQLEGSLSAVKYIPPASMDTWSGDHLMKPATPETSECDAPPDDDHVSNQHIQDSPVNIAQASRREAELGISCLTQQIESQ
eukprot:gene915-235_t